MEGIEMLGKIWRTIKQGITHFHYDERGDPATFAGIAAIIGPVAGAALAPEEQETLSYMEDPGYQAIAKGWAQQYGEEYPEFPGMPEQLDTYGTRLTEMLGGELSPAVQKYLTSKYQQAWTSALPHYADIGAGPGTLASQRIQMGERQAIEGAYMGQQQIGRAMEMMPQYTQMMLSPYMADVMQWQNVGGLLERQFPGADVADIETGLVDPATVTRGPGGSRQRREWLRQNERDWIARQGSSTY